jgi:membrane-bound lytic murein transglycosylase C
MNHRNWQALCIVLSARLSAARSFARISLRACRTMFRPLVLHPGITCCFDAMDGKDAKETVTRTSALLGLITFFCVGIPLLSLLAGFVPDRESSEARRPINAKTLALRPEDKAPGGAQTKVDGGWFYRDAISWEERGAVGHVKLHTRNELIAFTRNGVALLTDAGARVLGPGTDEADLHAQLPGDQLLFATPPPPQYGEALDVAGQPLRWIAARTPNAPGMFTPLSGRKQVPVQLAALSERPREGGQLFSRAQRYKVLVERFAERYKIKTELVYAIIHNESNFQPGIVSSRQAMGLMQLLPSTAGGEVHKFLHGHTSELDAEELMNPENNLRYGITYLHLLLTRHFGEVTHPESREFCAIAGYNLGPNALLNTFSRDRDEAIAIINSLSPQEVYERLAEDLPVRETRNFIARVLNSKKEFTDFQ